MHKLTTITLAALLLAPLFAHGAETAVDPCGPITYPGMTVTAGKEGVQAPGYTFVNRCKKPTPWQAQWIWLPAEAKVDAVACFRKEITLSAVPDQVMAWISADMKYRLWINGRLVSRGPVDIGRDVVFDISTGKWFYDARDLTPYFRKGVNVMAAEVFREWPINETVTRGHPGLLFEAEVSLPSAAKLILKSDATWRGTPALHYPKPTTYDAGKEPAGWRLPGFNDAQWLSCIPACIRGQSFKFAILFDRNHLRKPPHSLLIFFACRIQRPLVCRQGPLLHGVAQQAGITEVIKRLPRPASPPPCAARRGK